MGFHESIDIKILSCAICQQANLEYVPPYGSGGALYLRPLIFGSGPRIGLQPSDEYTMLVMAIPVGDYYKGGLKPTTAVVVEDYDRAAPRGVGHVKVSGAHYFDKSHDQAAECTSYRWTPVDATELGYRSNLSLLPLFAPINCMVVHIVARDGLTLESHVFGSFVLLMRSSSWHSY